MFKKFKKIISSICRKRKIDYTKVDYEALFKDRAGEMPVSLTDYEFGYHFILPPPVDCLPKDITISPLPKGFVDLTLYYNNALANIEYNKVNIYLWVDSRVKFITLNKSGVQDYPLCIELKFTLNNNDEGFGNVRISHKEKEEVIRLFNTIQESCISLNLNAIIKKLC